MSLPVPYEKPYADPAGQTRPATRELAIRQPTPLEPYGERQAVVYVPSAENPNVMVGIPKQYVQPMQPAPARDLTPIPLIDPQAQRILASGLAIGAAGAGVGFGAGRMFAGIALMGTSGLAILLGLFLLAANLGTARGTVRKEVHIHQKWFGKTNISN